VTAFVVLGETYDLEGWKDISIECGVSVRRAMEYETSGRIRVYRPRGTIVYARRAEIRADLARAGVGG
jgi:hypothetical protein